MRSLCKRTDDMEITETRNERGVIARITGEIDHHSAGVAREWLDGMIERRQPPRFGMDLSGVTFCDSSGLGLVMGRMRKCSSVGSELYIVNPSREAEKILRIAGMDNYITIEKEVKT